MPKVPPATVDDLASLRTQLEKQVADAKSVGEATQQALGGLRAELSKATTQISALSEKAQAADQAAAAGKASAEATSKAIEARLAQTESVLAEKGVVIEALKAELDQVRENLSARMAAELPQLKKQLEKDLSTVKDELNTQAETWARQAAEALVEEGKALRSSIEESRQGTAALRDEALRRLGEHDKAVENIQARGEATEDALSRCEAALKRETRRLEDLVEERALQASLDSANETLGADVADLRRSTGERLQVLEEDMSGAKDGVAQVENQSTRRVDWIIKDASRRLKYSKTTASLHRSWFSPKFSAAGTHGLQLELQLFRPSDGHPVQGETEGDVAVFLWACKGMNLSFRLCVGTKSMTLDKVYNGRVPYGTPRFCWLKDHIHRETDTLRVSVEILESIRDVELPIEALPPQPEGANGEDDFEQRRPLEGTLLYRRHLNNRLLDQVKQQVDKMQSRMVRRVEWRLEQASMLRRCFPQGETMCSKPFNAAGIEGMQLIFYPSGYTGSSDGYCSLYLFAPAGCTLKAWLCAGDQRREARHAFKEPGAFGRTNFCRFEPCIEEDDTLLLALEIEDAHQDLTAHVAHPKVEPGERRTQAQIDGVVPLAVESVVKLRRLPGKTSKEMEEIRVLPSLWTAKALGTPHTDLGIYSSFEELAETTLSPGGRRQGGTRRASQDDSQQSPAKSSLVSAGKSVVRSESVPAMGATGGLRAGSAGERAKLTGEFPTMLPMLGKLGDKSGSGLLPRQRQAQTAAAR